MYGFLKKAFRIAPEDLFNQALRITDFLHFSGKLCKSGGVAQLLRRFGAVEITAEAKCVFAAKRQKMLYV